MDKYDLITALRSLVGNWQRRNYIDRYASEALHEINLAKQDAFDEAAADLSDLIDRAERDDELADHV